MKPIIEPGFPLAFEGLVKLRFPKLAAMPDARAFGTDPNAAAFMILQDDAFVASAAKLPEVRTITERHVDPALARAIQTPPSCGGSWLVVSHTHMHIAVPVVGRTVRSAHARTPHDERYDYEGRTHGFDLAVFQAIARATARGVIRDSVADADITYSTMARTPWSGVEIPIRIIRFPGFPVAILRAPLEGEPGAFVSSRLGSTPTERISRSHPFDEIGARALAEVVKAHRGHACDPSEVFN